MRKARRQANEGMLGRPSRIRRVQGTEECIYDVQTFAVEHAYPYQGRKELLGLNQPGYSPIHDKFA